MITTGTKTLLSIDWDFFFPNPLDGACRVHQTTEKPVSCSGLTHSPLLCYTSRPYGYLT